MMADNSQIESDRESGYVEFIKWTAPNGKARELICIPLEGQDKTFSFGLSKARAILENIKDIERFVEEKGGRR